MPAYDPYRAPDPDAWMDLGEDEQIELVRSYHRQAGLGLPNEQVHAALHVVVENQAALGDKTPVAAAIDRLMQEGLDRHNAIHAVGRVLVEHLWRIGQEAGGGVEAYYDELRALTAGNGLMYDDE